MEFKDVEQARLAYLEKRKKVTKITLSILITFFIVISLCFYINLRKFESISAIMPSIMLPLFFCTIISFIIIALTTRKESIAYKEAYKTYFVAKSFASIFSKINYNHAAAMPEEDVRQVMTTGDRYSSNDYMTAIYKNINFAQADVHTERKHTDKDGKTHYTTIFRGRFLIFDFNRNFDFALQIRTDSFPGAILPRNANSNLKFHKLETESIDFNQDFIIYGQDGVDTFYILDPAFIEKLHNLYHSVGQELAMTFLDSRLYIAIRNNEDAFEAPNPKEPLDEKVEIEKISKDIRAITTFVDNLNLDKYTYKKGKH